MQITPKHGKGLKSTAVYAKIYVVEFSIFYNWYQQLINYLHNVGTFRHLLEDQGTGSRP